MATKAKKYTTDDALAETVASFEKFLQTLAASAGGKVTAPSAASEESDEDDDAEELELTREMVEEATASGIKALRTLATEAGIEATKKAEILEAFEELLGDEDEDDEDEDDDDDDDEEEGEEFDREELEEMSLAALRKLAKSEEGGGHSAADVKGLDQDSLIDLIMGEDDEDEDEDDDEDDEEDEEVEELDEDALKAMSHKDLLGLAKELEIKVPTAVKKASTANKKKLVTLILDSGDEDE